MDFELNTSGNGSGVDNHSPRIFPGSAGTGETPDVDLQDIPDQATLVADVKERCRLLQEAWDRGENVPDIEELPALLDQLRYYEEDDGDERVNSTIEAAILNPPGSQVTVRRQVLPPLAGSMINLNASSPSVYSEESLLPR